MANDQSTSLGGHRLIAAGAVAMIGVATALAFGRVFRGPETTGKLVGAALAAVTLAAVFERRNLWLATLASAAFLVAAVGVIVFPQTTLYGLPTEDTLRAMTDAVGRVGTQARLQVAPTTPLAPLALAALTAVWTASFSAHALALRAGSPLLAMLPPAALLAFSDAVLEADPRPGYGAVFLLGALAVLFVDGLRRVERWGPVWPWPSGRRLAATTTTGARRVALGVLLVAFLFPGILPGYGRGALLDVTAPGDDEPVGIDPLVSIKADLDRDAPVELFRVQADAPSYWRMLALDVFDGESWTSSDLEGLRGVTVSGGEPIDLSVKPDLEQTFTVTRDLRFSWIPVAYPERSIRMAGLFRYDDVLDTAVATENLRGGDSYTVVSSLEVPSRTELRNVVLQPRTGSGPEVPLVQRLPEELPPDIERIARSWTEGAATDFDKIVAIQDHLRSEFLYSTDVDARSDTNALVAFLTTDRTGFCQQFATAMAALLRSLGYPARVAVGFTEGTYDEGGGEWIVTTDNAHSWVEVEFPDYGWLAFEPTPTRTNPVALSYLDPEAAVCAEHPSKCEDAGGKGQADQGQPQQARSDRQIGRGRGVAPGALPGAEPEPESGLPVGLLLKLAAIAAVVLAAAIPPAKALRRRWRLRRARAPRDAVVAAYEVFADRAADLGLARRRGETPVEYSDRLAGVAELPSRGLDALTEAVVGAAYSPREPSASEAREAGEAGRAAIRVLRRETPLAQQVMGLYRLGRAA